MILWLMIIGFLSAFALGPASFNIIRSLVRDRSWPWKSIAGFLLGDIVYIALALMLLKSPLLQEAWLKALLTVLTVLCLVLYSVKILFLQKNTDSSFLKEELLIRPSFKKSFLLTMANFHLVFIYASLFANVANENGLTLWMGAITYLAAFLVSFILLLFTIRQFKNHLQGFLRKIEVVAACGFLTFSAYLSLGIL
ncbi:LysE family transporter [Bdellovibrio bacteriovorus]|uniref:LysE family transporter n=1 Tax=Bdellovibrio bacteriovorus TaxID=959 RepID=UPI0035A6A9F1